jgi:hypothetical protein
MKKIMSVLLGLSLAAGVATIAFGQDAPKEETKKKKGKKKTGDRTVVTPTTVR